MAGTAHCTPTGGLGRVTVYNETAEALGSAAVKGRASLHSTSLLTSCQFSVLRMPVREVLKAAILSGLGVGVVFSVKTALLT